MRTSPSCYEADGDGQHRGEEWSRDRRINDIECISDFTLLGLSYQSYLEKVTGYQYVFERECINANDLELQVAFIPLISCLNP